MGVSAVGNTNVSIQGAQKSKNAKLPASLGQVIIPGGGNAVPTEVMAMLKALSGQLNKLAQQNSSLKKEMAQMKAESKVSKSGQTQKSDTTAPLYEDRQVSWTPSFRVDSKDEVFHAAQSLLREMNRGLPADSPDLVKGSFNPGDNWHKASMTIEGPADKVFEFRGKLESNKWGEFAALVLDK